MPRGGVDVARLELARDHDDVGVREACHDAAHATVVGRKPVRVDGDGEPERDFEYAEEGAELVTEDRANDEADHDRLIPSEGKARAARSAGTTPATNASAIAPTTPPNASATLRR